jgi:hypothetical protein
MGFGGNLGFEMVLGPDGIVDHWWDVPVFGAMQTTGTLQTTTGTLQTNTGTVHAPSLIFQYQNPVNMIRHDHKFSQCTILGMLRNLIPILMGNPSHRG